MSLIERLFGRSGSVPPAPVSPGFQVYPTLVPYLDGTSALGLSAVFRCVTILADTIADLYWRELRGPEDGAIQIEASRLVKRPMVTMTRREWTWRVVATEALYNTAHLLHVGGFDSEGVPWSLLPVPPSAITPADPLADPWGLVPPQRYMIGSGFVDLIDLSLVHRAPFPGIPDHLAGILQLARRNFGSALAAETHHSRYWQSGGPTQTVLTTDQEIDDTDAAAIAQRWVNRRTLGADFPAVLGKGAKAEDYGANPTTADAIEARREMVADVGRYFGIASRLLNAPRVGDTETYANVEDDAVDLERYTLRGYMGPIEDAISELLPGDYIDGRRMRFDTTRLTQGSLEARARTYPPLVTGGLMSVDEARRIGFGLPPLDDAAPAIQAPAAALPGALVTVGGSING